MTDEQRRDSGKSNKEGIKVENFLRLK
jgi:hypothetical protein